MNEREATILAKSVAAECIAYRVRLLNRVITNIYDRAYKPLGLTVNQSTILVMLSRTDGASSADIGRVLVMEKSTVSRNVKLMRKNGWIDIADRDDGRSQQITVTAIGRKLLIAAHVEWRKAQKQAAKLLGEEGVAAVRKLHDTVRPERT